TRAGREARRRGAGDHGGANRGASRPDREEPDMGVTLLAGGNPQVPKGDGPEPVRTYLGAMPGWKREVGRRLDHLIEEAIPGLRKAVRWNQPHYGTDGETWLLSFRCYTAYVQVQFLRGTDLDPVPPNASKHEGVRYL